MMINDYSGWIGSKQDALDVLEPGRSDALRTALGESSPREQGAPLPPLHHWLYFWDVRPPGELGPDGHPARGGFLPPVSLPRRLWAGGNVRFLQDLRLGERVMRASEIVRVDVKSGRSGDLVFVKVRHEISGAGGLAVVEEQDIVYRGLGSPGAAPAASAASEPPWRREVSPDAVLLFRYSALSLNSHRIHYDRRFATEVEGYPDLVVHGPLQATLLADLAVRHGRRPLAGFSYRGLSPAFDGAPLLCCGGPTAAGADLWTEQGGRRSMTASAEFA